MPIRTACSACGKKLQVRDELAGKKIKCPNCGNVFVINAAAPPAQPGAPRPGPTVKATPPARSKRPTPPVTGDEEDNEEMPPVVAPRAKAQKFTPPVNDDDEDEESNDRPVRPRSKKALKQASSSRGWLLIAAVVVLLVAGGATAYFMFFTGTQKTMPAVAKGKQAQPRDNVEPIPAPKTRLEGPDGNATLADLVPGDTLVFASLSGAVWTSPGLAGLRNMAGASVESEFRNTVGFSVTDLERISVFTIGDFAAVSRSDKPPFVVVVQTNKPFQQEAVKAAIKNGPLGKNAGFAAEFVSDQIVLLATPDVMPLYAAKKGQARAAGVLERALTAATTSKGLVAALTVPPELLQAAEPALKDAPPFVASFLKTKAIFASLDVGERLGLQASLIVDDEATAKEMKDAAEQGVDFANKSLADAAKDPENADVVKAGAAFKELKFAVKDKEMTVSYQTEVNSLIANAMPVFQKLTSAAAGAASGPVDSNNLKQIVLAWHNYHDAHGTLPPQTVGKGLSWRVAILPYLEQGPLYGQFKLDEPWDSANNIKLLPLMPKMYETSKKKAASGFTFLQTFVGPNTINKDPRKAMTIAGIVDGTSNTIIVAEGARAIEWTKPADIAIDPKQPIVLGGAEPKFFLAAFADGSVRHLSRTIDPQVLRWLIDPADGNPLPPNWDAPADAKRK